MNVIKKKGFLFLLMLFIFNNFSSFSSAFFMGKYIDYYYKKGVKKNYQQHLSDVKKEQNKLIEIFKIIDKLQNTDTLIKDPFSENNKDSSNTEQNNKNNLTSEEINRIFGKTNDKNKNKTYEQYLKRVKVDLKIKNNIDDKISKAKILVVVTIDTKNMIFSNSKNVYVIKDYNITGNKNSLVNEEKQKIKDLVIKLSTFGIDDIGTKKFKDVIKKLNNKNLIGLYTLRQVLNGLNIYLYNSNGEKFPLLRNIDTYYFNNLYYKPNIFPKNNEIFWKKLNDKLIFYIPVIIDNRLNRFMGGGKVLSNNELNNLIFYSNSFYITYKYKLGNDIVSEGTIPLNKGRNEKNINGKKYVLFNNKTYVARTKIVITQTPIYKVLIITVFIILFGFIAGLIIIKYGYRLLEKKKEIEIENL